MIVTRFGNEVTIIGASKYPREVKVRYADGFENEVAVVDLRADNGLTEIVEAITAAGLDFDAIMG